MVTIDKNYIRANFKLLKTSTIVMLNGHYQPELSDHLDNLIFDGETLKIPKNTTIRIPLHLLFLNTKDNTSTLNIIAEENSRTTIIEEHTSLGENPGVNTINIIILAKTKSEITHYKLQAINPQHANYQAITHIEQTAESRIFSNFMSTGAKTAKEFLEVKLTGENAYYTIKGINLLHDNQEMNNKIAISHLEPHCTSNVLTKSVVDGQAINTFDCRVIASNRAVKTETHVTNKNLLLSDTATANTSPELEINIDDVICTHGATVGQLDAEALFYLCSRGITKAKATKILTLAFVQEIAEQFTNYDRLKIAAGLVYE